ncbi:MAG TPA: alpha/beta fold hydrolase [Allosphingosinicella sp.]|nr:alpha/beta fold hydrolase [Allosphingosinicella sp.]
MARALEGLRAYQQAQRSPPLPLMPAIAEAHGAKLRDYGGEGASVLFVPSLINPPNVLDLSAEKSLLRWLREQGHRVLLLDWGWNADDRRRMSIAGHVEEILLPLIATLDRPPSLVGYCLGGTMALAAAALTEVRSLALIAAPWHFSGFPEEARAMLGALWKSAEPPTAALGLLPMEALQSAFWSLDPARTVSKFEAFAAMEASSAEAQNFVTLEDWANDGPPLSEAAARELFEGFFRDDLPGSGQWRVAGEAIDPNALACPILNIVSITDRIVPHASAASIGERLELKQGHVGMVVGGRARAALWEPLAAWLSR